MNRGVLELDPTGGSDYTLPPAHTSCWITVDNISVYVHRTDEGVVVDLFPHGDEMDNPIASTYAFFSEAEDDNEPETRDERRGTPSPRNLPGA